MGNKELLTAAIEEIDDAITLLTLVGEVDLESAPVLAGQFQVLVDRQPAKVIIDASGVSFMDSTGIHTLVEGKKALHEIGATIVLISSRIVRRVLELVFPTPLFAMRVDSMAEAMAVVSEKDTPES